MSSLMQHLHNPCSQIHTNQPFWGKFLTLTNGYRVAESLKVNHALNLKVGLSSKEVMEDENTYIVGTYTRTLVVLCSGKRCKLYDIEGRGYLDLSSGIDVNALGNGDQDWVEVVVQQANTLTHVSNIYYSLP